LDPASSRERPPAVAAAPATGGGGLYSDNKYSNGD
jgi:hypothetical protein